MPSSERICLSSVMGFVFWAMQRKTAISTRDVMDRMGVSRAQANRYIVPFKMANPELGDKLFKHRFRDT